jgi:succinate-semialdehyde dehydrogenase/glutarate-semialdehyde dehydrogenase
MHLSKPSILRTQGYIDGKWVDADSGKTFPVYDPATGALIANVPSMGAAETRRAIEAANRAWKPWRSLLAKERSAILRRWFDLINKHSEDLAQILCAEQGKPIADARGEIAFANSYVEWFAEEAKRIYGDVIPAGQPNRRVVVLKESVGVVGCITPWNFPVAMVTRKCAPALAVGCTMVLKPAEDTPLSALALIDLAEQAGVPPGVFNIVTGGDPVAIGKEMTSNDLVRKISFTGSTEVGRLLMAQSAPTIKKLSLELGGNAPLIVFDDADLDLAVKGALASKYRNAGQTCVCANRMMVQDGIYEAFTEKLAEAVKTFKVGAGEEPGAQIGPLINADAVAKVERLVADALSKGGKVLTGGKRHGHGANFFEPTVIANATSDMAFAREEIFGPVAPIFRFKTEDEAVAMANDTEFGLAAYFFTKDLARAWRVSEQLEYGMVGINEGVISSAEAPFGGVKQSGLGREGSKYGFEDFLEVKYLCMGGLGG